MIKFCLTNLERLVASWISWWRLGVPSQRWLYPSFQQSAPNWTIALAPSVRRNCLHCRGKPLWSMRLLIVHTTYHWPQSQVCESHEKCRDVTIDLLDELDIFMSICKEARDGLEGRRLSKQALITMLLLIKSISDYICEATTKNSFGMSILYGMLSN